MVDQKDWTEPLQYFVPIVLDRRMSSVGLDVFEAFDVIDWIAEYTGSLTPRRAWRFRKRRRRSA